MISFQQKTIAIENALSGALYSLQAIDSIQPSESHVENVTEICNEPEIYRWLYREMFDGKPYPSDSAAEWISWGAEGWQNGTHFVFVILDGTGGIVASCDIKDADPDRAEIGYWASVSHRGVMTNAVVAMLELAEEAGFRGFSAEVLPENLRSQAVLRRTGFELSDEAAQKTGLIVYHRRKRGV